MRIGLTYDLRNDYLAAGYSEMETAEFDREDTVEALADTLAELGHQPVPIGHARQLMERLLAGESWDLVFNIAEGLRGAGREALVPSILDHFAIPYTFSDPLTLTVSLHKATAKRVVRDLGVPTPDFLLVENLEDLAACHLAPPCFVKPVAEGTGKGVTPASLIRELPELAPACAALLAAYRQAVLVEELLPGRELTVGVVGTGSRAEVLGTLEVLLLPAAEPLVYSYVNKERCEELVEYRLVRAAEDAVVREAEEVALAAWRALGCRDGGRVDLRCDRDGRPQFMEVNPLAGLHPEHSDLPILCTRLGIPYRNLIERIVHSATERLGAPDHRPVGAEHAHPVVA